MAQSTNPTEHRALALIQEALDLLDEDGLGLAACHLSMAIDAALAASVERPRMASARE